MYNMQSGQHRQSFPARLPKSRVSKLNISPSTKHTKAVTGLMIDSLNRTVVSCGLDGKVKFWDLLSGSFIDELDWHPMAAITGLRYNKASELVAFSCDDLSIRVIDLETRKLVREFWDVWARSMTSSSQMTDAGSLRLLWTRWSAFGICPQDI